MENESDNNDSKGTMKMINLYYNKLIKYKKTLLFFCCVVFFVLFLISEYRLFENETSKERLSAIEHPHYFSQTSLFLNPYFLEDAEHFDKNYRVSSNQRRKIKDYFQIYVDQFSMNHIMGNVYQALKTGKTIKELRSYNFVRRSDSFATDEDFLGTTLYTSVPNLTGKIVYNLFPENLKYIDTIEKEIEAGYVFYKIQKGFIFIHVLLWSLLIYVVGIRFNSIYSIAIGFAIFSFPGFSVMIPQLYATIVYVPLFPLYIFTFYPITLSSKIKIKTIIFYFGLALLILIQWSLVHWKSTYFQLPIILFSLAFYNFYHQLKDNNTENLKDILKLILTHIKKYIIQYVAILIFTLSVTFLVVYSSYKEMLSLQPENKDTIDYLVWERPSEGATKLSLVLVEDWSNPGQEKYYVNYSLENRIKHNRITINHYLKYPSIYPIWRLDYLMPESMSNFLYKIIDLFGYLSLYHLIIISLILNIYILFMRKSIRYKLVIPSLFMLGILAWTLIFLNVDARFASHLHIAPHMFLQYIPPIYLCYIIYLITLLKSNKKAEVNFTKH